MVIDRYDMTRSELLFILFQVTLKFWRFIFWKTQKFYMMRSLYDKAWISTRAIYDMKIKENFHSYMLLAVHWVQSSFVDPYERFVMLLKSRSCTHHIYLLLLHWEYAKTCFPFRSTQKCSTPTLGGNTKICLIFFSFTK